MKKRHFLTQLFSLQYDGMRAWHGRRILAVVFLLPFFCGLLLINRLALLLDCLLFPAFRRQEVTEPVFIVAPPRSGTTFLFHTLAAEEPAFTCFRLWEIIFAPAICQKYIFLFLGKCDRQLGGFIAKLLRWGEDRFFQKWRSIHPLGLQLPEEDEAVLLWYLGSGFLHHFYPDARFLDDLLYFDGGGLSRPRRSKLLQRYRACVQRHNYVFNRQGNRRFLSKNPFFMNKLTSLSMVFPDARVVTIDREPVRTMASTLSLNAFLYRLASARPVPAQLRKRSVELLLCWHTLVDKALREHFAETHLRLDFKALTGRAPESWDGLARFLELNVAWPPPAKAARAHWSTRKYPALTQKEAGMVRQELLKIPVFEG